MVNEMELAKPLRNTKYRKELIKNIALDDEEAVWLEYFTNEELLKLEKERVREKRLSLINKILDYDNELIWRTYCETNKSK